MSAADFLAALRARGFTLRLDPGEDFAGPARLYVGGAALTDADRDAIRGQREQLLDALWHEDVGAAGRAIRWPQESGAWDGEGLGLVPGGRRKEECDDGANESAA